MRDDVKICLRARLDFLEQYYCVPENMQQEVADFTADLTDLAQRSADSGAFEAEFSSGGLSDRFYALLPRLTPVTQPITAQQEQYSREVAAQLEKENPTNIINDDVAFYAKEEAHALRRKAMIEAGVYDEYTRATNVAEDLGLLGRLFKKKK